MCEKKKTRRGFIVVLLLLAWGGALHAAWLDDVPVTVVQPNGDTLHLLATGDEFFNYLHDAQGYTIMQHPQTGYYVYAEKQNGKLVATNIIVGSMNPATNGMQPHALISSEEWLQRRKVWEVDDQRPKNRDVVPNHGTLNNISIFIRFADDEEFINSYSSIDNMFNNETENAVSMINYFRSASYNAITIHTHFYPGHNGETIISYQDSFPRSYYQIYNEVTNPNGYQTEDQSREREFALLERAVNYVNNNSPVPTDLDIDYDDDGYVDNICFIVRGNVEGWNSLLWPHKWTLYDRTVRINGKRVYTFNFQLADATDYFNTSTMCHEMNHTLGAPDLYHYDDNWRNLHPVGSWDLMQSNAMPPQHCGAYMKMKYGHWIDEIPEITQVGTYTLNPISSITPENVAYKIATDDPNQFYVLEYRNTATPFESALPGSGLLIYRIDTRFGGNKDYDPLNGIYDEVYIFRPDGTFSEDGNLENACFSANVDRTEFSQLTNPYPFFSEGTLDPKFYIYDISEAGNTISFSYTNLYNIEVSAFPEQAGTVSGGGLFTEGSVCTVTATPNPGFTFMGWYGNALGTMLYSRQPEYTFTVTRDRHLYAKFVLGNYTVTTSCSPVEGGSVTGGGTYMAGSTVTLTATANSGYVFSCWTENGQVVSSQPTYSFTALSDRNLVANFMNLSFSLGTVITNPDGSKGVVFYINPTYTGGCMVALEDVSTGCTWGSSGDIPFVRNYTYTQNECLLSDLNGYANTEVLRNYQSANPNYASGKVDFENGWYVPSAGQLRKLFGALPFIEVPMVNAGGTTLSDNAYYWSSTESSESYAWTSAFEMSSSSKTSNYRLRAVHDFSINNTARVQLRTNNAELGTVAGSGFYANGATVTVTATPSGNNLFRGWTEAGHLVSQDPTYTFTANANRDLVANFAIRGGVGTLVNNPDGSQGVLFYLNDDGTEGWMVALEDASEGCQWGPNSDVAIMKDLSWNDQKVLRDQNGFYNTWLIRISQGTDNGYAASVVDFDNGWYLPSSGQLRKLYAELPMIEEAIIKAGGSTLTDGKYWSSTEYSASYASTPGFEVSYTSKTTNCRVRAIRNYVPAGDHVVLVAANEDYMGTASVSGSGVFAQNQTVTVTATPNAGYQFDHWSEDGVTVSYDAEYQFSFTRSRSLVANFVVPGSVGSVVTNDDGSRGIVFYADPSGFGGLMVALEDASEGCPWGTNEDIAFLENRNPSQTQNMLDDLSGYDNTRIIREWQSNNPDYAAGKVDYSDSWFLPSAGQMRKLYAALPLIEEAIVCAGGSLMTGDSYWSSSENSSSYAWSPSFEFTKTNKTSNLRVRAIRSILPMMTITATANSTDGGTVEGAGSYCEGQTCTLTATANPGYTFINWTENGEEVSTDAEYTFTVTGNRDLVANFELKSYTITATANPIEDGTVTGAGTYNHGSTCTLTATANEGYTFVNWTENGTVVSTNSTYSFTVVGDHDLVANFAIMFNMPTSGIIEITTCSGMLYDNGGPNANYSNNCNAIAVIHPELSGAMVHITGTYDVENNWDYIYVYDGESASGTQLGTFTGTGSIDVVSTLGALTVKFTSDGSVTKPGFALSLVCEGGVVSITATANPTEGGTISGDGIYNYGETATLIATPNECYTFINWTRDGTVVSTNPTYSFTVTENVDLVANFEAEVGLPGDANGDGMVNALDIVIIVNHIFGETPEEFVFANADINEDGIVNALDLVAIVNLIFSTKTNKAVEGLL